MDEDARWLLFAAMAMACITAIIGGLKSNVQGTWEDGQNQVVLRQYLFLLRGFAKTVGGGQTFRGTVFFGRVKLWRYDFGLRHLSGMGFNQEQATQLEGARTGRFLMKKQDADTMVGAFWGTHFQFRADGPRDMGLSAPSERVWRRVASP